MERRDVIMGLGAAAAATTVAGSEAAAQSGSTPAPLAGFAMPQVKPDPKKPLNRDIKAVPDAFFVPGRFAGKTVIVTGCARGMGQMAAIRLAREGANVVGVDWLKEEGEAVIAGIAREGGKARFVHGDVSESSVTDEMVRVAVDSFGSLDCALNNAGVMDAIFPGDPINYESQKHLAMAPIHEASDAYWDVVMRVNATGVFKSLRSELRHMVKQGTGGTIVNVSSVAGLRGFGGTPSYVASKHAVTGLTKNAAMDYAAYGIRVNSVHMANTKTPMVERAFKLLRERAQLTGASGGLGLYKTKSVLQYEDSQNRDSTAAEQVAVMLFLLSPESSNLTGANYATDGGFSTF
jgi:NAD(P)-dependent dehydrogenase (short-subunit alcohol dehydrogenase family)